MQIKYAIRAIGSSQTPCYLKYGQYGLTFAYVTNPGEIYYFNSREEAIRWIEANHAESRCLEIVEVYIPFEYAQG